MTAVTEIVLVVGLLAIVVVGSLIAIGFRSEIGSWFKDRRLQKARTFGYIHRSSGMEFSAYFYKTEAERKAYRDGWAERELDENRLGVDSLGSVGLPQDKKKRTR